MPAIDPARLRRQVDALAEQASDPAALLGGILEIFDFYRDRTRRLTASARSMDPHRQVYGVPRPVVRALIRGLQEALQADLARILPLGTGLWETGIAEAQFLATSIVGGLSCDPAADWVEALASVSPSQRPLSELAEHGLSAWRRERPQDLLVRIEAWLRSGEDRQRALAAYALAALVQDKHFVDLPAVYQRLEASLRDARGLIQPALQHLVTELAGRSAPETARLLQDLLTRGLPGMAHLTRRTLASFPPQQRDALERTLMAVRRAGIMPPS